MLVKNQIGSLDQPRSSTIYKCQLIFFSMVLHRIPTAIQPMTGIEGFKYQAMTVKEVLSIVYSSETLLQYRNNIDIEILFCTDRANEKAYDSAMILGVL